MIVNTLDMVLRCIPSPASFGLSNLFGIRFGLVWCGWIWFGAVDFLLVSRWPEWKCCCWYFDGRKHIFFYTLMEYNLYMKIITSTLNIRKSSGSSSWVHELVIFELKCYSWVSNELRLCSACLFFILSSKISHCLWISFTLVRRGLFTWVHVQSGHQ